MEKTNANDFRSNLKEWFETASGEPIKITRKTGEAFVLMNADEFEKMQIELASLRGLSKGLSDALKGNIKLSSPRSTQDAIDRAKAKVLSKRKKSAG